MRLSFTQEADFRQRRDFGQKFSATFDFIAAHWRGLGKCLLYLVLPVALLQGILTGVVQGQYLQAAVAPNSSTSGALARRIAMLGTMRDSPAYWLSVALGGVMVMVLVLTVYGYLLSYLRPYPTSEPVGPRQVWAVVKREFVGAYLSYFGLLAVIIVGMFLLFVPGMYLAVGLSLFYLVRLVEGRGFIDNCRRCLRLVRGKWWSTFGLLMVMSGMLVVVVGVFGALFGGVIVLLRTLLDFTPTDGTRQIATVVGTTLGGLLNLLIYPPILLALAFQYFNLVERRDGTGLHQLVSQIGQAPAAVRNADLRADDEGEY